MDDRYLTGLTPTRRHGGLWLKRDDLFRVAGASGGKARTCWALAQGAKGLVTSGSRYSPQINIVARIAKRLGIPCRAHTPTGDLLPPVAEAQIFGADIVQHKAGYNSVIIARARDDAAERGWTEIPFGMECSEAVAQTAKQYRPPPRGVTRLVVPVGSGMTLAGIVQGMVDQKLDMPVLGVVVGADPRDRLKKWLPFWHRSIVRLSYSSFAYNEVCPDSTLGNVQLDPYYEAKCLPFLKPGDLFWLVGVRSVL